MGAGLSLYSASSSLDQASIKTSPKFWVSGKEVFILGKEKTRGWEGFVVLIDGMIHLRGGGTPGAISDDQASD